MLNSLNNSIDPADKARALHRVVRAMHDGHCPKCGHLGPSETFWVCAFSLLGPGSHKCPECGFFITAEEAR
ncbi:MAG: hypothetical protein IT428_03920, partial [Planctomycetaceae bacterium]|nr:hypothetical protein [Planctomycetaceae bacterium]